MANKRETFSVLKVSGQRTSERRAVAFLICPENAGLNAYGVFGKLSGDREREVRQRFDYWIDFGTKDNWFHGFPNDKKYDRCFTFKWKEKRQHQRFYGFLSHAKPVEVPNFQACVLVYHTAKNADETDRTILGWVESLRCDGDVAVAIVKAFRKEKKP